VDAFESEVAVRINRAGTLTFRLCHDNTNDLK